MNSSSPLNNSNTGSSQSSFDEFTKQAQENEDKFKQKMEEDKKNFEEFQKQSNNRSKFKAYYPFVIIASFFIVIFLIIYIFYRRKQNYKQKKYKNLIKANTENTAYPLANNNTNETIPVDSAYQAYALSFGNTSTTQTNNKLANESDIKTSAPIPTYTPMSMPLQTQTMPIQTPFMPTAPPNAAVPNSYSQYANTFNVPPPPYE